MFVRLMTYGATLLECSIVVITKTACTVTAKLPLSCHSCCTEKARAAGGGGSNGVLHIAAPPGFPTAPAGGVNPPAPPAEANKLVGIQTRLFGLKLLELVSPTAVDKCVHCLGEKYFPSPVGPASGGRN